MLSRRSFLSLLAASGAAPCAAAAALSHAVAYRIDAVIVLFSRPLFSRAGVGEGLLYRDETGPAEECSSLRFAFAGGSWPQRARGLNRFGYFSECIQIRSGGAPQAQYFGFMTSSNEETLSEAARSLEASPDSVPVTTIHGECSEGRHHARLALLRLDAGASWSAWRRCLAHVAGALPHASGNGSSAPAPGGATTFLHTLSRTLEEGLPQGEAAFLYGSHPRRVLWKRSIDRKASGEFATRGLIPSGSEAVRFDMEIRDAHARTRSRFALWHDPQTRPALPLRIELQPRSFLRLRLEAVPSDMRALHAEMENSFEAWRSLSSAPLRAGL